jgi:thioredoxin 1
MNRFAAAICLLSLIATSCSRTIGPAEEGHAAGDHGKTVTITDANFDQEVLASSQPVLVDFWATWCGPCMAMGPVVVELSNEFEGRAKVGKLDVDSNPQAARKYGISGIPAFLFFKDGKLIEKVVGTQPKTALAAKLTALAK